MSESPRKTLSLPTKKTDKHSGRQPIRGGALNRREKSHSQQRSQTDVVERVEPPTGQDKTETAPVHHQKTQTKSDESGLVRLSKLMTEQGFCSRREADSFIEKGLVSVDGEQVTTLGFKVERGVTITLDKTAQNIQHKLVTILLNKPIGYVSGQPEPGYKPAVTLIQPENQWDILNSHKFQPAHLRGLAPAGRLDIDSTGLLVLTQDGRVAKKLIGENSTIDKEYLVRVEGELDTKNLALLNHGLSLDGKPLKPAKVKWMNEDQLHFTLVEGKKRQIRRMCELVGLRVIGLKRVRIGGIVLGDLPLGQWRYLREDENF